MGGNGGIIIVNKSIQDAVTDTVLDELCRKDRASAEHLKKVDPSSLNYEESEFLLECIRTAVLKFHGLYDYNA